jgi:hypothetical protein
MRIDNREKDLKNHDRGLDYDLPRLLHRRGMLKLVAGMGLAGAGLITLGACAPVGEAAEALRPLTVLAGRYQRRRQAPTRATAPMGRMC